MNISDAGHSRMPPRLRPERGVLAAVGALRDAQPGPAPMIAPQEQR
jgi:hypothetical protein